MRKCRIQLPLFGYLSIRAGVATAPLIDLGLDVQILPLFTSHENAVLFAQRVKLDCVIVSFLYPQTLISFLEQPPGCSEPFTIAMDLVDQDDDGFARFEPNKLLQRLKASIQ